MGSLRQVFGSLVYTINIILAAASIITFRLVYSANVSHWAVGFVMLATPVLYLLNAAFFLMWLFSWSRKALLSLIVLIFGFPLIPRTFTFHFKEKKVYNTTPFKVLSYNLMYSDAPNYVHKHQKANTIGILKTIDTLKADIKCFQELYNWDDFKDLRTIHQLTKNTPYYTYMHSSPSNNEGQGEIGLAIFSKFPIIKKREEYWKLNNNGMLAADIVINKDTIRVLNVQLRSMGIRVEKVIQAQTDDARVKKETRNIISQLKEGFEVRSRQVMELEKWIIDSPYPLILCGDFNEIPFGFSYGTAKKYLANSFEDRGSGFGFTYNRLPNFIRIDNQFYNAKKFNLLHFQTLSDIPYSDHNPIVGQYQLLPH